MSTDCDVSSYEPGVPDVSRNDVGVVTDNVASDVTDDVASDVANEEWRYDVAECVNLPADRDVSSYEPGVPDVSDDADDVVHIGIISYYITANVCGYHGR